MTTMTPELARRVAADDMPGLRRDFDLGVRYLVVLVLPASVLFACLAQPMIGDPFQRRLRGGQRGDDRRRAPGVRDQLGAARAVPVHVARLLRVAATRAHRSSSTASRTRSTSRSRSRCTRRSACRVWPSRGAPPTSSRRRRTGRPAAPNRRDPGAGPSVRPSRRPRVATGALAIVTIPLAAAIGRTTPSRALLATAAAATAGAARLSARYSP